MRKMLLIGLTPLALAACNKAPVCETWEISHECKTTDPSVFGCNGSIDYLTVKLCDEQLQKAKSGKDEVIETSPGVKRITHYIRRVK